MTVRPYRRFPLWVTLLPLVAGVIVWALLWNGYRHEFQATLQRLLPPDTSIAMGGFPYRLEARVLPLTMDWAGDALTATLTADEAVANRVPWQAARTVLNLRAPDLRLEMIPLRDAVATITAPAAQASLRTADGRIARLSIVWDDANVALGWLPITATAETLEAHLRETPARPSASAASPRLPTQDQLVINGTNLRFGAGDPLAMMLDSEVTANQPVTSLAGWLTDGTVEIRALTLSDATGEVARFSATLLAAGDGTLRLAGTVETVCPQSVRAVFAGRPAPSEKRIRRPETIAFTGILPGRLDFAPEDPARPPPPVRGQQPPCPRLL